MENILQIADLTKRYPDFYLDHLTLNVPSGSIVGLIGENGAGKTTTMNLILNAVTKDSGDILVFGQDNLSHEKEVKQRIGVVQDECKHRLTRAHREKQLKMSCQALHNAPPNRT